MAFAQFLFQRCPMMDVVQHLVGKELNPVLAGALHPVHGDIGMAHQLLSGLAMVGKNGDADAGRDEDFVVVQLERLVQSIEHLVGHPAGVVAIGDVRENQGELVAAMPGQRIALAQAHLQARGDFLQQQVAVEVAEGIIDDLEAIEIDEQHRQFAAIPFRLHDRQAETVAETAPGSADRSERRGRPDRRSALPRASVR